MVPIALPYIYSLSGSLKSLSNVKESDAINIHLWTLLTAENELRNFLHGSVYTENLGATKVPGMELLGSIQALTQKEDTSQPISFYEHFALQHTYNKFETVLSAEWTAWGSAFLVTKKRGFDSGDLLNEGEKLFPPSLSQKVPEAINDVRMTARCIAFELCTAAGFHCMRALEVVLRRYWDVVTDGAPRPKTNNMGDYLKELDSKDAGNKKTRGTLRQIKDLHRNELIHPEVSLDLDEAIGLLNITQSAMDAMLREIPGPQPTDLLALSPPLQSNP